MGLCIAGLMLLAPLFAIAHTGMHWPSSFTSGLLHPIFGLDHLVHFISIGILFSLQKKPLRLGSMGLFIFTLVVAAYLGSVFGPLPMIENAIVLSLLLSGSLLFALTSNLGVLGLCALAILTGFFHGYAHGTEIPHDGSGIAYGMGMLMTSILLVGGGAAAKRLMLLTNNWQGLLLRVSGSPALCYGLYLAWPLN